MVIKLLLLAIAAEALIELWLSASPLQRIRRKLILWTPFLMGEEERHLLDCPTCCSVYIGFLMIPVYLWMDNICIFVIVIALNIHRLSNFLHLLFSYMRDKQINLRIRRF